MATSVSANGQSPQKTAVILASRREQTGVARSSAGLPPGSPRNLLPPGPATGFTSRRRPSLWRAFCLARRRAPLTDTTCPLRAGLRFPLEASDRYLRWYPEGQLSSTGRCFDVGNTVRSALGRFARKQPPAIRGTGCAVDCLEGTLLAVDLRDDADTTGDAAGQSRAARTCSTEGASRTRSMARSRASRSQLPVIRCRPEAGRRPNLFSRRRSSTRRLS